MTQAMNRRSWLAGAAALGCCGMAAAMDAPGGPVVLTVSGKIKLPNARQTAQFDMAMLAQLQQASFSTRTPWYAQARRFSGPLMRDVLAAVGAHGQTVRALALNDYRVDIPVDDARRFDVLLARLIDDKPMTVRDKGPLFVIYPFDMHAELRTAVYYNRCAWQLRALELM